MWFLDTLWLNIQGNDKQSGKLKVGQIQVNNLLICIAISFFSWKVGYLYIGNTDFQISISIPF